MASAVTCAGCSTSWMCEPPSSLPPSVPETASVAADPSDSRTVMFVTLRAVKSTRPAAVSTSESSPTVPVAAREDDPDTSRCSVSRSVCSVAVAPAAIARLSMSGAFTVSLIFFVETTPGGGIVTTSWPSTTSVRMASIMSPGASTVTFVSGECATATVIAAPTLMRVKGSSWRSTLVTSSTPATGVASGAMVTSPQAVTAGTSASSATSIASGRCAARRVARAGMTGLRAGRSHREDARLPGVGAGPVRPLRGAGGRRDAGRTAGMAAPPTPRPRRARRRWRSQSPGPGR